MAKQRQAKPRPAPKRVRKPRVRRPGGTTVERASAARHGSSGSPSPPPPARRTAYLEAVALYERGLKAFQASDFARADELLRSVLDSYPDERELHESVHLYLNVCERHNGKAKSARPMNTEERIYAATLALNSGDLDQALAHVGRAVSDDPGNDHAHYTRAIALAARGQRTEAVSSLARAIELNPENRGLARHDPDLESLRQATDVRQVVDTLLAAPRRRGGSRSRPSR